MPGVARVEISKPAIVGRLEVSAAIDSRPDRITPGTHWIGGSIWNTASKQRNIPSERAPKKIPPRNGPQRKYHPIVVVTNKKQT
jgi:hypothetical protein